MIRHFKDLLAWQKAHQLALHIYKTTDSFPQKEQFILIPQMRRCSTSVSANIAEGFSRRTANDKIKFYVIAKGSLTELENFVILSKDLQYISDEEYMVTNSLIVEVSKLIVGIMRSAQGK